MAGHSGRNVMEREVVFQLIGMGLIFAFALSLGVWLLVQSLFGESTMQLAAKALGVEAAGRSALGGEIEGVSVRCRGRVSWGGKGRYSVDVELRDPQAAGMASIRPRSVLATLAGNVPSLGVDLGGSVNGDLADMVSRLDPGAREALATALKEGWVHEAGTWRLHTSSQTIDAYWIEQATRRGLALTKALRRDGSVAEGLMARATDDGPLGLRVRAAELRLEADPSPTSSELAALLRQDGEVGLRVAELLGDAPALRRALHASERSHRVRAAVALSTQGAADDEVRRCLRAALGTVDESMAVEALGRVGTVEDVPELRAAQGSFGGAAIEDAVRVIQERAVGAEAGQVSLADVSVGGLGLARDPRAPEGGGG
jgi:hypothetical protein